MILTLVLLTIIIAYFLLSWLWRRLTGITSREPPLMPGALPIIGHALLFFGDTISLWKEIKAGALSSLNNGGVVRVTVGTWNLYMMTDPEYSYRIGNTCLHKDIVYDIAKPWLGEGLVTAPVDVWKRHRKLVNPGFSQYVLDGYLTVFNSQSKRLVDNLADKVGLGYFDHVPYLERTALEIICLTAMGIDDDNITKNYQYMDAVSATFHSFVQRVQSIWMINNYLFSWSALKKKQDNLIEVLHGMSNEVIQRRKAALLKTRSCGNNLNNTPKRFKSFLDLLLESSMDGSLSDIEIRDEVDTMISAGFDTSATLLTYAFVVIGSYPEVQEKIFKELEEVFDGSDRDVEKYDLPKLVYLEAVLKECLRFYPVVPLFARYLDKDIEFKNYTLKAGSSCFILVYGVNRHSVWGADVNVFKPERWLNPAELPNTANAFAAFGLGRRTCIGPKFALMSLKTTMCHILRKYRLFGDHTKMILKMDIMLKAHSGHHIRIEKR